MSKCINCNNEGPHFVPPSFGDEGFFMCNSENWDRETNASKQTTEMKEEDIINLFCASCKHFMPINDDLMGDLSQCRRHAPYAHTASGWPGTYAGNWCGDHEKEEP